MEKLFDMEKRQDIISGISYVTFVNAFSMVITAFLTLILPKYISTYNYGIWQLFIFYQGYLGVFHFGWNDGIYLRYGGADYKKLKKETFYSQFWIQIFVECILAFGLLLIAPQTSLEREFVIFQLSLNLVLLNSRYMLIYILQATSRIKEFACVMLLDRFSYVLLLIMCIIFGRCDFITLIWSDTISKAISYILAAFYCRNIIFGGRKDWIFCSFEIFNNIRSGSKIMLANIASIMITGICRYGIEQNWTIDTFGQISLTITLSQLFITFVTNIGLVLYPTLKQMESKQQKKIYLKLKNYISFLIIAGMIFYYPGKLILQQWLGKYKEGLEYMGILLPICFFESKMGLLNGTYLKALREEKTIMYINGGVLVLGGILTWLFSFRLHNLTLSVLSITILLCARCTLAERTIYTKLSLQQNWLINRENFMMISFVISNYIIGGLIGFGVYCTLGIVYLIHFLKKMRTGTSIYFKDI